MNITPSRCPSVMPDLSPSPTIPKSIKSPAHIRESGISLFIVSFATFTVANHCTHTNNNHQVKYIGTDYITYRKLIVACK